MIHNIYSYSSNSLSQNIDYGILFSRIAIKIKMNCDILNMMSNDIYHSANINSYYFIILSLLATMINKTKF